MRKLIFILLLWACADEDILYTVVIKDVQKNVEAYYCVYRTQSIGEPKMAKDYFLDDCGKYVVGDTVVLRY